MAHTKGPGDDLNPGTPNKQSRRIELSSDEDSCTMEDINQITLADTHVNDVLVANQPPPLQMVKQITEYWNSPIVLIVTKGTRDKWLSFLDTISNNPPTRSTETGATNIQIQCGIPPEQTSDADIMQQ